MVSMQTQKAIITGISGQDGSLLAQHLLQRNYQIIAPVRENYNTINLQALNIESHKNIHFVALQTLADINSIILEYQPDEIYHLAAFSHVGQSHDNPQKVFEVNSNWTLKILQAIKNSSPETRLFFASSCEIFDSNLSEDVDENSPKKPSNPYGISKLAAHNLVEYFRDRYDIYSSIAILFNHESELRSDEFVSKKICQEVVRIVKHGGKPLMLGNINAKKDWGYAPDYVKLFPELLKLPKGDDFVFASGKLHSVKDMVEVAFASLNYKISWKGRDENTIAINSSGETVVAIDTRFYRPMDNRYLIGNKEKLAKTFNINLFTPYEKWVKNMVLFEYQKL